MKNWAFSIVDPLFYWRTGLFLHYPADFSSLIIEVTRSRRADNKNNTYSGYVPFFASGSALRQTSWCRSSFVSVWCAVFTGTCRLLVSGRASRRMCRWSSSDSIRFAVGATGSMIVTLVHAFVLLLRGERRDEGDVGVPGVVIWQVSTGVWSVTRRVSSGWRAVAQFDTRNEKCNDVPPKYTQISKIWPDFQNLTRGGIFVTPPKCQIYPLIENAFLKKSWNLLIYTPP